MAAPNQQPLQGSVSVHQKRPNPYQALLDDPTFIDLPELDKVDYLEQEYLPKVDTSFNDLDPQDRREYIKSEVMPYVIKGLSGRQQPPGQVKMTNLQPQGWQNLEAQTYGRINEFRNKNPLAAGAYDLLTPHVGFGEGFLQGMSAQGYKPRVQANENFIRGLQRGAGQFTGSMAGFLGTSTMLTPWGAGALYGGAGNLNQQLDEGRSINNLDYTRLAAHTALGAGTGGLPAHFGGRLPTRMAMGGGLGALTNTAPIAIDQMFTQGKIDLRDPAYMQAALQGAGMGVGSAFLGGPGPAARPHPISLSQVRQSAPARTLQAHATMQAPPRVIPSQPQNVGQRIQQAGHRLADFKKEQANKTQAHRNALRQAARDLHEMLHSDDADTRIQGQALKEQFKKEAADVYSKVTPGKVRKKGNPYAKQVLAELEIHSERLKARATYQGKDKTAQDGIVKVGLRMRATEEGKAKFEAELSKRFNPDEKRIIMGRIKDIENKQVEQAKSDKERKTVRRTEGLKKRNEINRKRQEEKQSSIKRENDRIKAELEQQRAENKAAKDRTIQERKQAAEQERQRKAEEAARQKRLREIDAENKRMAAEEQRRLADEQRLQKQTQTLQARTQRQQEREQAAARRRQLAEEEKQIRAQQKAANDQKRAEAKRALLPKVLEPEQIERLSDELLNHYRAGEKGTLGAKINRIRSTVRTNHAKDGLINLQRSEAIQETHARILDRFNQKKAELDAQRKPATKETLQARVKAREENLKDLEAIKAAGGHYDLQTGKGREKRLTGKAMRWDEVKDYITDSERRAWGESIDEAMRKDGEITKRYDAERSGDTGQFEYKRVAPKSWGLNAKRDAQGNIVDYAVVYHAVNKNGHTGEYYLTPSDANPQTGTISAVLEAPIVHTDSFGTAKRNGDPNVYYGPREFNVREVMARPPRKTEGLTSELQAKYLKAKQLLESVENNRKAKGDVESVPAAAIRKISRQSKALQDVMAKDEVDVSDLRNLSDDLDKLDPESKHVIDDGTGCK